MFSKIVYQKQLKFFKSIRVLVGVFFVFGIFIFAPTFGGIKIAVAATNLDGRILLQVQDKGQAWYVNPLDSQRYYLDRPDDAFALMRSLGLGATNSDINTFKSGKAPRRLAGRILLQVQDKGQAYYIDPLDLKLYYLGRPADAFNLMRSKGLGITNADLAKIPVSQTSVSGSSSSTISASASSAAPTIAGTITPINFVFKYQNNTYQLTHNLSSAWYDTYKNSSKIYTYSSTAPPADLREAFYGLFLTIKSGDTSLDDLIVKMRTIVANNNWSEDQLAEFALALIQYIPYDRDKVGSNNFNANPYYPYETLYLNRGVCSDKTFLAVAILRKLGYGAAILDFPDSNHSAVGIACPAQYSINASGYCYVETTNYFPFSAVPQSLASGQAEVAENNFSNIFSSASLGKMEIYQKTTGKIYYGAAAVRSKVDEIIALNSDLSVRQAELDILEAELRQKENELSALKAQMDEYYNSGQISQYNSLVPAYNALANEYNVALANYRTKADVYNALATSFNNSVKEFYQK